jgi:hypothetical protein
MTDFPDDELHTKSVTFMGAPYSGDVDQSGLAFFAAIRGKLKRPCCCHGSIGRRWVSCSRHGDRCRELASTAWS